MTTPTTPREELTEKAIEILSRVDFQSDRMKRINYLANELEEARLQEREALREQVKKLPAIEWIKGMDEYVDRADVLALLSTERPR